MFGLITSPGFLDFLRSQLQNHLPHFFAGLEFDDGPLRNGHMGAGVVRVSPQARFAHFNFEDTKIAEFDFPALRYSFRDVIEDLLNNFLDLFLDQAGFLTDSNYEISFGHKVLSGRFSTAILI